MVKKMKKYVKFVVCMALIMGLVAPSYAALSASDGSAFVTKAEFDSALADFNARLTTFEAGINSKIDSQVTSYLDRNGIWNGKEVPWNPELTVNNGKPNISFDMIDYLYSTNPTQEYNYEGVDYDVANISGAIYRDTRKENFTQGYASGYTAAQESWNAKEYSHSPSGDAFLISTHWQNVGPGANNLMLWATCDEMVGENAFTLTSSDKKIKVATANKSGLMFIHWDYNTESNGFCHALIPKGYKSMREMEYGMELNADWVPFVSFGVGFMIGDTFQNRHELATVTTTAVEQYDVIVGTNGKFYGTGMTNTEVDAGPRLISIPFNFGDITTSFFVQKGDDIYLAPHTLQNNAATFIFGALTLRHVMRAQVNKTYSVHGGVGLPMFGLVSAGIY